MTASAQAMQFVRVPGIDQYTKILLHFDGNLNDNGGNVSHTWTNNSTTYTSTSKFGGQALSCLGSQWIDTPDSADFTLGSNDFTIDFWFNVSGGSGTTRYICGQADSSSTVASESIGIRLTTGNVIDVDTAVGGSLTSVTGTTTYTTTGWHHCAIVRASNVLKLFLDGTQEGGNVAQTGTINDSANKFSVGRLGELATLTWNGLIDEFRLSVGIARWTANFTPPALPYS